jgi:uncharacterized protein (TIGR00369 family)
VTESIVAPIYSPFIEYLGIRTVSAIDGEAHVVLPLDPHHLNVWNIAHGGVIMTMLDIAMGGAARSLATDGSGPVTIEMKTNFMQPGSGELRGVGRVLHKSTTMAYCEAEIFDPQNRMVAKALGTFKYVRAVTVGRQTGRGARQASGLAGSDTPPPISDSTKS